MTSQDFIVFISEKLFFGFGCSVLIALGLSLFRSPRLKTFSKHFIQYALCIIKWVGIVYFVYYLARFVIFYASEDAILFNERSTGPYAYIYWYMVLRPLIFCAIAQLFWIEKVKASKSWVLLLTLIIFGLVLASGPNLEFLTVVISNYQRDYFPQDIEAQIGLFTFLLLLENIALFTSIVLITWFITKKIKEKKNALQ